MPTTYHQKMQACNTLLDQFKGINNDCCTLFAPKHKKYLAQAETALGHELPQAFKNFYAQTDGLQFRYWNRSKSIHADCTILPLKTVFGGWKRKKNGTLGQLPHTDWTLDVFEGVLWFENDAFVRSPEEVALLKQLKVLESISSESSWITIHFEANRHQLYLVTKTDIIPLDLDIQDYFDLTFKFCGLDRWWALYLEDMSKYPIDYKRLKRTSQQLLSSMN